MPGRQSQIPSCDAGRYSACKQQPLKLKLKFRTFCEDFFGHLSGAAQNFAFFPISRFGLLAVPYLKSRPTPKIACHARDCGIFTGHFSVCYRNQTTRVTWACPIWQAYGFSSAGSSMENQLQRTTTKPLHKGLVAWGSALSLNVQATLEESCPCG